MCTDIVRWSTRMIATAYSIYDFWVKYKYQTGFGFSAVSLGFDRMLDDRKILLTYLLVLWGVHRFNTHTNTVAHAVTDKSTKNAHQIKNILPTRETDSIAWNHKTSKWFDYLNANHFHIECKALILNWNGKKQTQIVYFICLKCPLFSTKSPTINRDRFFFVRLTNKSNNNSNKLS